MEHVDKIINKDPLKLKDKEYPYVSTKLMYILAAASALFLILGCLFFFMGKLFGGSVSDLNLISEIQVDVKIMPSQNTYRNMAEMSYISSASLVDESDDYIDNSRIDVNDKFFYYDNTGNYFPVLHFD